MNLNVNLNFWFDGMDDCTEQEIKNYLESALEVGSDSTASEISNVLITRGDK